MQVEARQRARGGSHRAARRSGGVRVGLDPLEAAEDHASGGARDRRDARVMARLRAATRGPNIGNLEVAGAGGRLSAQRLGRLIQRDTAGDLLAPPLILERDPHQRLGVGPAETRAGVLQATQACPVLEPRAGGLAAGDAVSAAVQGRRLTQLLPDVAHLAHIDPGARIVPAPAGRRDRRVPRPRVVLVLLTSRITADRAGHEAIR